MATGATGTPTSNFGIPKYATSADAPNGTGFNSAMDYLDNLLLSFDLETIANAKGDLLVATAADTLARLAVGANGTILTADSAEAAGVKWAAPSATLTYTTTLPGSPTDGQEVVLVDSLTAPTYIWRLRYNAGSASTYKWEFIGGSEKVVAADAAAACAGDSLGNSSPVLSYTIPYAGDWDITVGGLVNITSGFSNAGYPGFSYSVGATAADFQWGVSGHYFIATGSATKRWDAIAASTVVTHKNQKYVGTGGDIYRRRLHFRPVRII